MSLHPSRSVTLALVALSAACASTATRTGGPAAAPVAEHPRSYVARPTGPAITPGDLMSRSYLFADDSMLGRESGTLGNVRATDYVAREMQRIGLEPAGENGTYFQTVPVVLAHIDSARTLSVDGAPLAIGSAVLPFYAGAGGRNLPNARATRSLDGVQAIYGGEIGGTMVSADSVAGKLVVFTVPIAAATGRRDWRFYLLGSLTSYASAAGIAVASLDVVPSVTMRRLRGLQTRPRAENVPDIGPAFLLVTPSAAQRLLGGLPLESATVGTAGRTVSGNLVFVERPAVFPSRNVVGILRGSDPVGRHQYVAVGAHNDHIGLERRPLDHDSVLAFNMVARRQGVQDTVRAVTPAEAARIRVLRDSLSRAHGGARADSVNNGADDDGSGTVTMLEIAEAFARAPQRPRRSLLFVSHTGEEKGLWGSQWYTDHPTVPRDSIVAQLNMDMVGRGKATDAMGRGPNNIQLIGVRRLSTELGDLVDSVNANRPTRMDIDPTFDANGHPMNRYCRSDHYMYARYGIPIAYFSLGYHTDYHQITDEPQYLDFEHMARVGEFVHDIAAAIAARPTRLVVDKPKPDPHGGCRQ